MTSKRYFGEWYYYNPLFLDEIAEEINRLLMLMDEE